jgi:hypothetical protein
MRLPLDVRSSGLLKLALDESRTTPLDFFDHAPYPQHRAVKEEVEQFVAEYLTGASAADLDRALERHREYLTLWVPHRLERADREEVARLCAFAELHGQLLEAEAELMLASLSPPKADDLVFDAEPELFDALTDGLMRLLPAHVEEQGTATNAAFFLSKGVLFPHPFLAEYRELLGVLAELAGEPRLRVYVALDPYRRAQRDDVQCRLLEDYWDGMKLTAKSLDSLDAHDQGTSFHAAGKRDAGQELFNPLLGTWFDWRQRADDGDDPVKRLYIREVKPPTGPFGRELSAVINRALHAERDTRAHSFSHVDGKVCRYPVDSYAPSLENPRAEPGPPERARKLWRVDGELKDAEFAELTGLFFRGNELIEEHFSEAFSSGPPDVPDPSPDTTTPRAAD